jgi:hypothetical protein
MKNAGKLRNLLFEDVVAVEFQKKDGTVRDMKCTLNFNRIPEDKIPKAKTQEEIETTSTNEDNDVFKVFDVQKNEWRSFRKDSIISINGISYDDFEEIL